MIYFTYTVHVHTYNTEKVNYADEMKYRYLFVDC